jgi:hypothetical protein
MNGLTESEVPVPTEDRHPHDRHVDEAHDSGSGGQAAVASQQVSWFSVHQFVQRYLDTAGHYPPAGTPAWCELSAGDRRKWAALLDFAQHHALRVEIAQEARAEASRGVSEAADWAKVGREINGRNDFYTARPWLRRRGR